MGNNGEVKTPEELKKEKEAKFFADPDKFICVDDIIMASVRTEHGLSTLHGACTRVDMEVALTRLNYKTYQIMQAMDMQNTIKAEEAKKKIITGKGVVDFARRMGGRQ